jgi:TPR repeat protein
MVMVWYRKAAEQGYVDALYNLGLFYATGQGTQVDEAEAYALWSVAAKMDSGAKSNLEIIRTKMSPAEIQSGRRRAEELENRIRLNLERSAIR